MKYYLTAPEAREPSEQPIADAEVRSAIAAGEIEAAALLWPDGGGDAVSAQSLSATPPPLPPRVPAASVAATPRKSSLAWLWWLLGITAGAFVLLVVLAVFSLQKVSQNALLDGLAEKPLFEDRKPHQTKWQPNENYKPSGAPDQPDGEIFQLVHYPAEGGEMTAYLTPDPGDGKKHPVMIWDSGGWGGIGDFLWDEPSRLNDQSARAFREAGIVLMCPSFRGENGNPGEFELFYGEVNDFLSAIEYAKGLPYVDPERVYIGGHSTGGTVALLAAVSGVQCRGVFSFGGAPDMLDVMSDGEGFENTPYSIDSTRDHELRSPIRYTHYIQSPTFYIEGAAITDYVAAAKRMQRIAKLKEVPFQAFSIPNADHFDVLTPLTQLVAQKIVADTGEQPISLTQAELVDAWNAINDISLHSELSRWLEKGGDLVAIFDNLEDDIGATSSAEIDLAVTAIKQVLKGDADSHSDIAELAELVDYIGDEELSEEFLVKTEKYLLGYIERRLDREERSEQVESNCMRIAGSFGLLEHPPIQPLLGRLAAMEVAPDDPNWGYLFDKIEDQSETSEFILQAFREAAPTGVVAEELMSEVNNLMIDAEELTISHPYNTEKGGVALEKMIRANGDETFHATLSLAFVDEPLRAKLLPLVIDHKSNAIQMEAAWADAKNGGAQGLKSLQDRCLDVNYSNKAKRYLRELDLAAEIPAAAQEPDFRAKSNMVAWLLDEQDGPPLSIEQIDKRELIWPPFQKEEDNNKEPKDDEEKTSMAYLFEFTYPSPDDEEQTITAYGIDCRGAWSSLQSFEQSPSVLELYSHFCAIETNWDIEEEGDKISDDIAKQRLQEANPSEGWGE